MAGSVVQYTKCVGVGEKGGELREAKVLKDCLAYLPDGVVIEEEDKLVDYFEV